MKEKTIYALGFFDGVHLGHQALLGACRELAERHGCKAGAVTFADHPDALIKGTPPGLISTSDVRRVLLQRYGADNVVELPFDEALMKMPWQDFICLLTREYGAAGFVCGADFRFGHRGEGNPDILKAYCRTAGMPCVVVPEQQLDGITVSSTHIRKLLETGEMEQAIRFLGHPYILTGQVISGRKLGRTLGIPTANLALPPELALPKFGVYACRARVDGQEYLAVTNLGMRPTVGGHHVTVEPWLLDMDADLYGKALTLFFHAFLRPEKNFPDLDTMRLEIEKNAAQVRNFFEKH